MCGNEFGDTKRWLLLQIPQPSFGVAVSIRASIVATVRPTILVLNAHLIISFKANIRFAFTYPVPLAGSNFLHGQHVLAATVWSYTHCHLLSFGFETNVTDKLKLICFAKRKLSVFISLICARVCDRRRREVCCIC